MHGREVSKFIVYPQGQAAPRRSRDLLQYYAFFMQENTYSWDRKNALCITGGLLHKSQEMNLFLYNLGHTDSISIVNKQSDLISLYFLSIEYVLFS